MARVFNPLPFMEISSQYHLKGGFKGGARVRSMLKKGVKRHLSSQGRKQNLWPSYPPIPQDHGS